MTSIRSLNDLCERIVAHSRNNPSTSVPATAEDRQRFQLLSLVDTAVFTGNALGSLSPMPAVTAVPTIAFGFGRLMFGVLQGFGFCSSDATPSRRSMIAGAALMAGGATAFIPVVGSKVNFALAAWSGAELAAGSLVTPRPIPAQVT